LKKISFILLLYKDFLNGVAGNIPTITQTKIVMWELDHIIRINSCVLAPY